ncbi:MAG: MerR family transcriptional regulator [Sphingobium sp.]|jgi:DNA-binding transcriptional MerR regulator|nr:MAG: MerR family transcriptional regulator [Stutzerimonas stutzeri]
MLIGEVAKATGLKIETIRFYEAEGFVSGAGRTKANYRVYEQHHVARLSFIKQSRDLGFTLEQIRHLLLLTDEPPGSCEDVDHIVMAHLEAID